MLNKKNAYLSVLDQNNCQIIVACVYYFIGNKRYEIIVYFQFYEIVASFIDFSFVYNCECI